MNEGCDQVTCKGKLVERAVTQNYFNEAKAVFKSVKTDHGTAQFLVVVFQGSHTSYILSYLVSPNPNKGKK